MINNKKIILAKMTNIKKRIEKFIEQGNIELAKEFIDQYEEVIKDDVEICSIKAVVLIIEKKYNEAKSVLNNGLTIDYNNFDITYNLAYLHEMQGEYNLALNYYKAAYEKKTDPETFIFINNIIKGIIEKNHLNINADKFLTKKNIDGKSKVLILCSFYSIYTKEYIEKMYNQCKVSFDILTMEAEKEKYKLNLDKNTYEHIYSYKNYEELLDILCLPEQYNIIHVHFLSPFYGQMATLIREKCNKLIVTIWGSDFYRTDNNQKELQRNIINFTDIITFDNEVTREEFCDYYGKALLGKSSINLFGLTALEYIKQLKYEDANKIKKELGIPENYKIITCGYNANPAHNHIQIINSIKKIKDQLPNNLFFIFPMTYGGSSEYINSIKSILENSGLKFRVIEAFMDFNEIAKITKITDILVQVQITDTLSATMQEHLFNGNLIITGNWLPYSPLKERGIYFEEVSAPEEVGKCILDNINKIESKLGKLKANEQSIWQMSAWENTIESWNNIYCKDIKALFNHKSYWNNRYSMKYDIESAGSMGLGQIYNNYIYKSKVDVINYLINELFISLNNKKVLELGPGTGFYTEYFYNNFLKEYLGIDISEVAVNNLKNKFENYTFRVGDVSDTIYYSNTTKYDLIFAANVLLHLTDKEKFESTIENISKVLNEEGYFISIEPITLTGESTNSLYHSIIDIIYMEKVLQKYNLEVISNISPTFFMNYPFDYKLADKNGQYILEAFNYISQYLYNSNDGDEYKEKIIEILYYLDKLCLLKYKIGTCEKILTIRKRKDSNVKKYDLNVSQIWDQIQIDKNLDILKEFKDNEVYDLNLNKALKIIHEKLLNRS